MTLPRADLLDRMARSLQAWQRALGHAAAGGAVMEIGELVASVVPAAPSRSLLNAAVAPAGHRVVDGELRELTAGYAAADVKAWGVWAHHDDAAGATLGANGLVLDSRPVAMALEIADLRPPCADASASAERATDLGAVAPLLGAAFGFPATFLTAAAPRLLDACDAWVARIDGVPAAGALIVRAEADAGVFFVGTAPQWRGRGAAGTALHAALLDARAKGCTTSTLQASAMGRSLYVDLGFAELGTYELWEHRAGLSYAPPTTHSC